jgi:hypothetical protein
MYANGVSSQSQRCRGESRGYGGSLTGFYCYAKGVTSVIARGGGALVAIVADHWAGINEGRTGFSHMRNIDATPSG